MRILLVGAGGVGNAIAKIAATRTFYEKIVVADYTQSRADEVIEAYEQAHVGEDADTPAHTTLNPHLGHASIRIDHVFAQRDVFRVADADIILDQADATGAWASDHYGVRVRLVRAAD